MVHKNNKDTLSYREELEIAIDLIYNEIISPTTIIDNSSIITISPRDLVAQHYKLIKELEELGELGESDEL